MFICDDLYAVTDIRVFDAILYLFHSPVTDLRRQARQLENELDLKLVSFSKLGAGIGSSTPQAADAVPLISKDDKFETLSAEIEQILSKVNILSLFS
jgi:uncharacterized circularly permuted ATP-grasp superfamily protein